MDLPSDITDAQESLAAKAIFPLRVLLALMSIAGLIGWTYAMLVFVGYFGVRILVQPRSVTLWLVYAYLLLSLYVSSRNPSVKTSLILGVVLNLPLVALFIYTISTINNHLPLTAFTPVAYVLAWSALWLARWFVKSEVSAWTSGITMTVACAILLVGGMLVWPLTVDHESEAQKSLIAAFRGTPVKVRPNLAEALRHASQVRDEHRRTSLLRDIAIAQARQSLYEDSNETIKTYLESHLNHSEMRDLRTSILRAQLVNKHYDQALITGRLLISSGRFAVQPLTLEAISQANAGKLPEAQQILEVAKTLANEQLPDNVQTQSFIALAEAHSKIGLHDEALNWARRVEPHVFGVLGSNGVNEAEAGFKESARHTMQVIEETLNSAVAKCLNYSTAKEKDDCLLKLVDKLADGTFFRLARETAEKITALPSKDKASRTILKFERRHLSDIETRILK